MQGKQTRLTSASKSVTGPGASAIKYDILTALLVTSTRGDAATARLALRLSLLITARFNWRQGTFAVGQREMARMWGVTERTAKREISEMRARGWISVAVPAARGRVTRHAILFDVVLRDTIVHWDAVGPDFAARMANAPEPEAQAPSNVVRLHRDDSAIADDTGCGWADAAGRLRAQDPSVYGAWFAALVPVSLESGKVTLMAPNRFQAEYVRTHFLTRLLEALVRSNREVRDVSIVYPAG